MIDKYYIIRPDDCEPAWPFEDGRPLVYADYEEAKAVLRFFYKECGGYWCNMVLEESDFDVSMGLEELRKEFDDYYGGSEYYAGTEADPDGGCKPEYCSHCDK